MVKHEDMMERSVINAEGYLFAIDNRYPKFPLAITDVRHLNPEYVNVLAASALLYRIAHETAGYLEHLIGYLESKGLDEAVASAMTIQASLNSAKKIAIEGMPKKSQDGEKIA